MPPVPDDIRTEFTLLTARQLQKQARLMFLALLLVTPMSWLVASDGATDWIKYDEPLVLGLICLAGVVALSRDLKIRNNFHRSAKLVRHTCWGGALISVMTSAWCVHSWYGAPEAVRIYYPFMIALGTLASVYCLASVRPAAIAVLAINLLPITALLITSNQRFDLVIAGCIAMAAMFQLQMIAWHRKGILRLLLARQHSHEQALTDPLTGLMNRRALLDTALTLGRTGPLRLLCVDIDYFKAINDEFGHAIGDEVLCEVAARLAARAELRASVARTGGEEFVLIGLADVLPEALALALLVDIAATPMPHGGQVTVSIGVAEGTVVDRAGWSALCHQADSALYQAKAAGRNSFASASSRPTGTTELAAA